jgi:hypothetical protein
VVNKIFFDCSDLPPRERAKCYRSFAECAEHWAGEATTDQLRSSYRMLAEQWRELARMTQGEVSKVTIMLDDPELASLIRTRGV